MKIVYISIHNFLKLKSIEMNPSKTNVIVGKNKQGKTSILKAIKAAFDGKVDESVIRDGESKAEIIIKLSELYKECPMCGSALGTCPHTINRESEDPEKSLSIKRTITEKGTYLDVSNKEGYKVPAPQRFLDGIIGTFSFNPVQFFELKPIERKKYLLNAIKLTLSQEELAKYTGEKLAGIDYTKHALEVVEDARKYYYDKRTGANAEVTKKRKTLDELSASLPEGFDPKSVSEEHIKDLQKAIHDDELVLQKQADHEKFLAEMQRQEKGIVEDIAKIEADLVAKKTKLTDLQKEIAAAAEFHYDLSDPLTIETAKETLKKLEGQRELVFTHKRVEEIRGELSTAIEEADKLDAVVTKLTKEVPQELIAKAELPVEGLTVTENDVLINGISLDNLSASEQLKFALNIVRKLNETFKVICIDGIETLDKDTFETFLKEIEADDYQYFVTRVDGDVKGGIVIEDGAIKK